MVLAQSQTQRLTEAREVMQMSEMGPGRTFCGQPDSRVLAQGQSQLSTITRCVTRQDYKSHVARQPRLPRDTEHLLYFMLSHNSKLLNTVQARSEPQIAGGRLCTKEH